MKRAFKLLCVSCVILFQVSCDDIFEDDITDEKVVTVSPEDKAMLDGNAVQLSWNEIKNTESYRVKVKSKKSGINVLDSLVSGTTFLQTLTPDDYEWQVRGENSAYQSQYSEIKSFSLISSEDLSFQNIFLSSPSEDFFTNGNSIILSWNKIQTATSYFLEVEKTIQGETSIALQEENISNSSFSLTDQILNIDGIYTWKVKGVNEQSETSFSDRKIFLDTNSPPRPELILPINNSIENKDVIFSWQTSDDTGEVKSPIFNTLEVSTNQQFTENLQSFRNQNTSNEITFTGAGEYYWRVKSTDQANNSSLVSEVRKITVRNE